VTRRRLGVVMDPIAGIRPYKDSTLAMLLAAQARGWQLQYMEMGDLRLRDGRAEATMRPLTVADDGRDWFSLGEPAVGAPGELDVILMRTDPPVDLRYIAATYILERAEAEGALVVNRAAALRDTNEKVVTAWFPQCCPPGLLTSSAVELRAFLRLHGAIVLKPIYSMGGRGIFVVRDGDPNTSVIIEELTGRGQRYIAAQAFIPDVASTGDKRILLIDGEPVPHAIARIPAAGELRANIAAGGTAEPAALTDRERWICREIAPELRARGLYFVGIDVIGGYLTEVNVTSPTCIREIDRFFGVNIAATLLDALERRLHAAPQAREA
jgi:glutathione synthase